MGNCHVYTPHPDMLALDEKTRLQWARRLESGQFDQGHGLMLDGGKFCCLGVLGDMLGVSRESMEDIAMPHEISLRPEFLYKAGEELQAAAIRRRQFNYKTEEPEASQVYAPTA